MMKKRWVFQTKRTEASKPYFYQDFLNDQIQASQELEKGKSPRVFLAEVEPVVTFGRRAHDRIPHDDKRVLKVDRGGLETWHGPGQWVLFPVEKLEAMTGSKVGVKKAILVMLESVKEVARVYDVEAEILSGDKLGVWTKKGKLASVGISVQKGFIHHGIAMNVQKNQTSFSGVNPCGLFEKVAYLSEETSKEIDFNVLGKTWAYTFSKLLGYELDFLEHSN